MIFNPVIVGGGTKLPELENPGTAADLLAPKQLIDAEGNALTGTIATKAASDLTASGATVSVPAGYYPSAVSKSVSTATQATPSITVGSTGLITASSTQTAGYVTAGTKSATLQLTTQAAQTITPGTTNKTIASGRYLTGTQTIKGDANLLAANIKSGVSIFGVAGTLSSTTALLKEEEMTLNQDSTVTISGVTNPSYIIGYADILSAYLTSTPDYAQAIMIYADALGTCFTISLGYSSSRGTRAKLSHWASSVVPTMVAWTSTSVSFDLSSRLYWYPDVWYFEVYG